MTTADSEKRQQIRRYFTRTPKWPWLVGGFGALMLLQAAASGLEQVGCGLVFGLPMVVISTLVLYKASRRPPDSAVDDWTREHLDTLWDRAVRACGLDASEQIRDPERVIGPRLEHRGNSLFGVRRGGDGFLRYSPIDVVVLQFTAQSLAIYRCCLDLGSGEALNESTHTYYYRDIVAVEARTESLVYNRTDLGQKGPGRLKRILQATGKLPTGSETVRIDDSKLFVLTTSGGTSVKVLLGTPALSKLAGGGEMRTEHNDDAVQAVRMILKEKRVQ